jgi:hypothetical protein
MVDRTETVEITEAMTPKDLLAACREVNRLVGPKAETSISVVQMYGDAGNVLLFIRNTPMAGISETIRADTWPEAFSRAREWATTHRAVHRNSIVRKMALAIIGITDEHGRCTEARLRGADFSREDIIEFHESACERATEMAGNAPFVVLMGDV